ncbi:hypothetical protein FACS189472_16180 [Alphaproteobacteria bacterium]|nr:hypothetical protein FACS189472_16180 [Alphaproteobacteria bacterium]
MIISKKPFQTAYTRREKRIDTDWVDGEEVEKAVGAEEARGEGGDDAEGRLSGECVVVVAEGKEGRTTPLPDVYTCERSNEKALSNTSLLSSLSSTALTFGLCTR